MFEKMLRSRKQLLVDISELVQRDAKSGIQRVVRSILSELLNNPPRGFHVEPVFATLDDYGYRYARTFASRIFGHGHGWRNAPIKTQIGDVFLVLDLQPGVIPRQAKYLTELRRQGVRVEFVIYDILPVLQPKFFVDEALELYKTWLRTVVQFDGAICISQSTADDVREWIEKNCNEQTNSFNLRSFQLGSDIENSLPTRGLPENAKAVLDKIASRPSFLMVGTIEPRKGHAQVVAAFDRLWAENIQVNLVVVGKQGWMVEQLMERVHRHPQLGEHLFLLEGVSDEYLEKIYKNSVCLIAASAAEGFGLPLLEAAKIQLPIIARDIKVFREVADGSAFFFQGFRPVDLEIAVKEWLELYKKNHHPKSDRINVINWKQSTELLINALIGPSSASQENNNGSGQLAVLRRWLKERRLKFSAKRLRLKFGSNGSGLRYLGSGWSRPESWGIWSEGSSPEILIENDGFSGIDLELVVRAGAAIPSETNEQTIGLTVNGIPLTSWVFRFSGSKHRRLKAIIPAGLVREGRMVVSFHPSRPISPAEEGRGLDSRKLGICISELTVSPARKNFSYRFGNLVEAISNRERKEIGHSPKTTQHQLERQKIERELLRIESLNRLLDAAIKPGDFEIEHRLDTINDSLQTLTLERELLRLKSLSRLLSDETRTQH